MVMHQPWCGGGGDHCHSLISSHNLLDDIEDVDSAVEWVDGRLDGIGALQLLGDHLVQPIAMAWKDHILRCQLQRWTQIIPAVADVHDAPELDPITIGGGLAVGDVLLQNVSLAHVARRSRAPVLRVVALDLQATGLVVETSWVREHLAAKRLVISIVTSTKLESRNLPNNILQAVRLERLLDEEGVGIADDDHLETMAGQALLEQCEQLLHALHQWHRLQAPSVVALLHALRGEILEGLLHVVGPVLVVGILVQYLLGNLAIDRHAIDVKVGVAIDDRLIEVEHHQVGGRLLGRCVDGHLQASLGWFPFRQRYDRC